jgi:hypothetical protein
VGKQDFFKVGKAHSQIIWLILLMQNLKFAEYASLQIANLQIFKNNPQIRKISTKYSTAQLCLKTVLKAAFLTRFFYFFIFQLETYMLYV